MNERLIKNMPSAIPLLMASGKKFDFSINIRIELTEEVDVKLLRYAVEKARARYPYFYVCLTHEESGNLQLVDNPEPIVVNDSLIPPTLLCSESNNHIQAFSCEGKIIWHHIHHAFIDGTGVNRYIQTILYLYFSEKYHKDFNSPGVRLPGDEILQEESTDPLLRFYPEIENVKNNQQQAPPPAGFGWDSKYIKECVPTVFYITVPEDAFVKYSKDKDSSPATLPIVFMLKTIYALHDEKLPVNAIVMANGRQALMCDSFMGTCVSQARITYPPKLRDWDVQQIATVTRGAVILQTHPDSVEQQLKQLAMLSNYAWNMKDKQVAKEMLTEMFAPKEKDSSMTIGCSYPGAILWGELNDFISSINCVIDPSADLMTFSSSVSAINGKFCITHIQNFSSDVYVKQFCKELEKEGICCTCSRAYPAYYAKTSDINL